MKRMKIIFIMLSAFIPAFPLLAQDQVDNLLKEIEQNNTTLSVLRQQAEADKLANKTGIYLSNPQVEYHYLWGNKNEIGNRTDFSASQDFDFPTAYYHKRKVADSKNMQADLKYRMQRTAVLLEAKQLYVKLIYQNQFNAEQKKRLENTQQIARAYQLQFDKGRVSILDRNKAQLSLLNAEKAMKTGEIERELLVSELARLNGGQPVSSDWMEYSQSPLTGDFETWYAGTKEKNLMLQYLQKEIALSKQSEKLTRTMNLPKFSAGYMSEKVMNEQFQGVTVGISIPLWENKNTVKRIKVQTQTYQQAESDASMRYYNELKAQYSQLLNLQKIMKTYKETFSTVNSSQLLDKALDKGEISLINYFLELGTYYDAVNQILETERDLQLLSAELSQWDL